MVDNSELDCENIGEVADRRARGEIHDQLANMVDTYPVMDGMLERLILVEESVQENRVIIDTLRHALSRIGRDICLPDGADDLREQRDHLRCDSKRPESG